MRKFVLVLFFAMVSVSSFAVSGTPTFDDERKAIRAKIVKLLGEADFDFQQDIETSVDLLINKKGEIVILSIYSKNSDLSDYLKRRLNYRRVSEVSNNNIVLYKVPIRVVKEI